MKISKKEANYINVLNENENKWIATSENRDILYFSDDSLHNLLKKLKKAGIEDYVLTKVKPIGFSYIS